MRNCNIEVGLKYNSLVMNLFSNTKHDFKYKNIKNLKLLLTEAQKVLICTKAACPSLRGPVANLLNARDSACLYTPGY